MTLFEKLKDIVPLGWDISFENELFNLVIKVSKWHNKIFFEEESWLPLEDHFKESRIVDCIDFMVTKINNSINEFQPS